MCFNFQKVSKSRDRLGDMTADDAIWVNKSDWMPIVKTDTYRKNLSTLFIYKHSKPRAM